jgi:hypothetical protein
MGPWIFRPPLVIVNYGPHPFSLRLAFGDRILWPNGLNLICHRAQPPGPHDSFVLDVLILSTGVEITVVYNTLYSMEYENLQESVQTTAAATNTPGFPVKFMTHDAYRARVGDEVYKLHVLGWMSFTEVDTSLHPVASTHSL